MPEGHSVHRIARQFAANFLGTRPEVTSPQGRFAAGAARLTGREMTDARAVGKQMFLEFDGDEWLRVHLGIYGAWDFAGEVRIDPSLGFHATRHGRGRIGQTGMAGPAPIDGTEEPDAAAGLDRDGEDSVTSIGAPRRTRMRMAEADRAEEGAELFPPAPIGQVRARLLTERVCADLRGPTACEVLTPPEVDAVLARLGPDPANENTPAERERFVARAARGRRPIGLVLMDQSVIAGIGNVYRAELLFRAGIDPHVPASALDARMLRRLFDDWAHLLQIGITVGQMLTIDGLEGDARRRALEERDERHFVYRRAGLPCRRCGTNIALETMAARKLYWCPGCQHAPAPAP